MGFAPALAERFTQAIERESAQHAVDARVARSSLEILSDGPPVHCDAELRGELNRSAGKLGLRSVELASGAGHDAAFMTRICPSAMVFVPCRDGKSHTPEEWADRDAIAAGAAVVLDTIKSLDQTLLRTARRATLDNRSGGATFGGRRR